MNFHKIVFHVTNDIYTIGTITRFLQIFLCRAENAQVEWAQYSFLCRAFYAELFLTSIKKQVWAQCSVFAQLFLCRAECWRSKYFECRHKKPAFSLFQAMRGHRAIGYCVILLYFVIFGIQRPQFYNFNKMLKIVARLAKFLGR